MFDDYNNFYKGTADGRGPRGRGGAHRDASKAASLPSAVCGAPAQYLHPLRVVLS
jgi:hypothetical protein